MRIAISIAVTGLALTACAPVDNSADPNIAASPSGSATSAAKAKPKSNVRRITYRIGGSAHSAMITYSTPSGTEQQGSAQVPWKRSLKVKRGEFTVLSLSAQNGGGGTITCEIDVDGVKVKAAKSSGQYTIASCDHTLGL